MCWDGIDCSPNRRPFRPEHNSFVVDWWWAHNCYSFDGTVDFVDSVQKRFVDENCASVLGQRIDRQSCRPCRVREASWVPIVVVAAFLVDIAGRRIVALVLGPSVDQTRIRNDEIDPIERVLVGVRRFWYAADRMFVYAVASMFD